MSDEQATTERRITARELYEIESRCATATPPPWRWGSWDTNFGDREPTDLLDRRTLERYPQVLDGSACVREPEDEAVGILTVEDPVERYEDALFIMKSRADVPLLVAEVRRLQTEVARLEKYKAAYERVRAGWDESWDCSRDPGHGKMESAFKEAAGILSGREKAG